MTETLANFSSSTLNGGITNADTTIVLNDGSTFPSTGTFRIRIDDELISITSRSTNTLTVTSRGIEGTAAVAHSNGVNVYGPLTKGGLDAYIPQQAVGATVGGQATGTVSAMIITNTHGTSGVQTHHAQAHTVSDHTTAINVSDEGTPQGAVSTVNFVGSTVAATVAAGTATVTVTPSAGTSPPFFPAYIVASPDMPTSIQQICDSVASSTAAQTAINVGLQAATAIAGRTSPGSAAPAVSGAVQRGMVLLTGGRFTLSGPCLMYTGDDFRGMGLLTDLRASTSSFTNAGAGSANGLIKIATVNEHMFRISDMFLNGASSSATGNPHAIYIYAAGADTSAYPQSGADGSVRIHGLHIENFGPYNAASPGPARHGIWLTDGNAGGSPLRAFQIYDIRARDFWGNGLWLDGTPDGHVSNCEFGSVVDTGVFVSAGNVKLTNVKVWYANLYGMHLTSGRGTLAGCEIQDCFNGVYFDGSPYVSAGLLIDTSSQTAMIISSSRIVCTGFHIFNRGNGRYGTTTTGFLVDAAYQNCMITGTVDASNITFPIDSQAAARLPTGVVSGTAYWNWVRVRDTSQTASFGLTIGT